MSCDFKIIDYNYVFKTNTGLYTSSESINFPVSNLKNVFRSKVWRTTGFFEVTAANQDIDFKDSSGGPILTATLTIGTYTPDELETEIKSQMEAVGGNTYTVSFSTTTGKWTISSSGVYLSLLFSSGPNNATGAGSMIGFDNDDYLVSTSHTGASIAIHTSEYVIIDLRSEEDIDAFALVFDPVLDNKFSEDMIVTLEANATQNFSSPAFSQVLSIDNNNEVITHFLATALTYRYWRVKFQDPKNPYLYIEVPKLILGKKIAVNKVPEIGFTISFEDKSIKSKTLFGHEYVDVLPIKKKIAFEFRNMRNSQIEEIWKSYTRNGAAVPVVIEIDGQETLFDKDRMFIYGKYQSDISSVHVVKDYFNQSIAIEESF